jgi:hypothetical protein
MTDALLFVAGWLLLGAGTAGILCLTATAMKAQRCENVFTHGERK